MSQSTAYVQRRVCPHDCPDTCALLVHVEHGKIVKVVGHPDHPTTRGFICAKVHHYPERMYSPDRLLTPLKRTGPKGSGQFVRISWDEAIATISQRFREISEREGAEAILPYSYAGTEGILNNAGMDRRFFHRLGASLLARTICSAAGKAGYNYTTGAAYGADPENIPYAKLLIVWGANSAATNVHILPLIQEARKKGAVYIVINPHRNSEAKRADIFLQPRPGTDAALALGMMHVIIREKWYDAEFVRRFTFGFAKLQERVGEYPPDKVAAITGVPPAEIERVARLYATIKPAFLRAGWGIQRHSNGGMTMRTVACLPGLVGSWGEVGGGFLFSNGGMVVLNTQAVERPDLISGTPRTINMSCLAEALLDLQDPPVKALYVYNSNPAVVAPNQNKVLQGLLRDDLFIIVHDQMMTDTARYADMVLPATTCFEHMDLYKSYWHLYLQVADPVIPPIGESKSNVEVFSLLAKAMGFTESCFSDTPEEMIRQALATEHPYVKGITLEELREKGWVRLKTPAAPFVPFADGHFPTSSGKLEFFSRQIQEKEGLDPLPTYVPLAESPDGSPALHRQYPINLINASAKHFVNSSFGNVPSLMQAEKGMDHIEIHIDDAKARQIADGDLVRVFNERGECILRARVGESMPKGSAMTFKSWWNREMLHGNNINRTTSDRSSDIAGGATFYTNLVEVERVPAD